MDSEVAWGRALKPSLVKEIALGSPDTLAKAIAVLVPVVPAEQANADFGEPIA